MISAYCITQTQDEFSVQKVFEQVNLKSLDQANRLIPDGVYTTFRTYDKFNVLDLDGHFDRLELSARLIKKEIILNRVAIRQVMRELLQCYPAEEVRVRLSIPLTLETSDAIKIYVLLEKLVVPSLQDYENGVRVITMRMCRENPAAKTTSFIHTADEIRQNLPAGVNEVIMIDENGRMLEGLSSNFFAIKGGAVFTDDTHVLAGITRKHVLEIIQGLKIPLCLEGVLYEDIPALSEAFITSTSRGVLPVSQIDNQLIGQGRIGEITRKVMDRYQLEIQKSVEPI